MKKWIFGGVAAVALAGIAPALAQVPQTAQTVQTAPTPRAEKVMTRAEVQAKVTEMFAKLDTNRDGAVTKAEADASRAQLRQRFAEKRGEHRGAMFDRLDTNRDGAISRQEFDSHRRGDAAHSEGSRGKRIAGMRRMGGFGAMHGRMFELADANKDSRVTLQEATAAALQHFDRLDSNRDGRVTRDEMMQMHRQRRGQDGRG